MDRSLKSYRVDTKTKQVFRDEKQLFVYDKYEAIGPTTKFYIGPAQVTLLTDKISGLNTETYIEPLAPQAPTPAPPAPTVTPEPILDKPKPTRRAPAKRKP